MLLALLLLFSNSQVVNSSGVLDCAFHPTQPWLFTAGADGDVMLWCN
jgi:ribosome biogenesis protein ERB1